MSKYVCNDCSMCLSTKYALERHTGTSRCLKNQRDAAKDKITPDSKEEPCSTDRLDYKPLYDYYFSHLRKKHQKTIFRNTLDSDFTPITKRYCEASFTGRCVVISSTNTVGHVIHNLRLTTSPNCAGVSVHYNYKEIFNLDIDSIDLIHKPLSDITNPSLALSDLIFGNAYLPLGKLEIRLQGVLGQPVSGSVTYDTYILSTEEARRQSYARELYYNCWYSTNVKDTLDADLLTQKTHAYVADIYYQDQDNINPDYKGRKMFNSDTYHYSCLPEGEINKNISTYLFPSLIAPGTILFSEATELPVIIRYISVLRMEDGMASTYADLYRENPKLKAKREIAERIKLYKEKFEFPIDTITATSTGETHLLKEVTLDGKIYYMPAEWEDTPASSRYTLFEPEWALLEQGTTRYMDPKDEPEPEQPAPESNLEYLINQISVGLIRDAKIIEMSVLGPVYSIDGVTRLGSRVYCFKFVDIWYALNETHIDMYKNYKVKINEDLREAIDYCVRHQS